MRDILEKGIKHPLISGSSIVFIGSFLVSIGNYIYNLLMGRFLSVEDYGLLTSLTSLFILFGLFSGSFMNLFVKFSASYKGAENDSGSRILYTYGFKFISIFGIGLLLLLLFLTPLIKNFLHIENTSYIFYIIAAVLFSLFLTLPLGFLQGRMQFVFFSLANLSQPIIKIIIALFLISLGFAVVSPLIAIVVSVFIPMIVLYFYLHKNIMKSISPAKNDQVFFRREFIHHSYTYFLAGVGIALMSNTDILLVRYFFDEVTSGQYSALSLMGKVIFYLIMPINFAFFPLIAYKKEKKERLFGTVLLAFGIVTLVSLSISFVYFAFPSLILSIFFPSPEYQLLKQYLGLFSLYVIVFSLATLLNSFFLSIGKTQIYKISILAAFLQITLIVLFHESIYQVIGSLFISSLLFFIILLVYYVKHGKD